MAYRRHKTWARTLWAIPLACLMGCGEAESPPWANTPVDTYTDAAVGSDAFTPALADLDEGDDATGHIVPDPPLPEPECASHGDCDDDDLCTLDTCALDDEGAPTCLHTVHPCPGEGDACLETSCDPAAGCSAEVRASDTCCFDALIEQWRFDAPGDEVVVDPAIGAGSAALWHLTESRSFTGHSSYLFAIPGQGHFDDGAHAAGRLSLQELVLPSGTRPELRFHLWPDVADSGTRDLLVVHVDVAGQTIPVWRKTKDNVVMQAWNTITVDLSAFAGASIWLSFTFDSVDDNVTTGEGLYLDDIWVWTGCQALACTGKQTCDDGLACTEDLCVDEACSYAPIADCCTLDSDCFDANHCTMDLCLDAVCTSTPSGLAGCCNTSEDCDDGDPCTQDLCVPGDLYTCEHQAVSPSGTDCPPVGD